MHDLQGKETLLWQWTEIPDNKEIENEQLYEDFGANLKGLSRSSRNFLQNHVVKKETIVQGLQSLYRQTQTFQIREREAVNGIISCSGDVWTSNKEKITNMK